MGRNNVLADSLSRPNQILGSEWTLKTEVFQDLRKRWPVSIDLFATSLNHQCCPYFSPFHDPNALGTDALLQNWSGWQAYAFPPWSLISAVLKKLRSSSGVLLTIIAPYWPQKPWFPELLDLVVDGPIPLPLSRDLLRQPHFHRHLLGVSGLSLHAWRLSSDSPGLRVSPRKPLWLDGLRFALAIRRNGQYIGSGAVRKDIPSLVLLFLRWPTFCFGFVGRGNCLCLLLWDAARCSLRFFVFGFLRSLLRL